MPFHCLNTILEGPLVSISTFDCWAPRGMDSQEEEFSSTNDIVFVRRGAFVRTYGREESALDPTQLFFFNAQDGYRIKHPVEGGDACTIFSLSDAVLREWFEIDDLEPPKGVFRKSASDAPVELYARHRAILARSIECVSDLEREEEALSLCAAVMEIQGRVEPELAHDSQTAKVHRELAEETRVVLNRDFSQNLRLAEIASRVAASPYHLARVFKRHTGFALHQYVEQLRIRAAIEMLSERRETVQLTAALLGYSSPSHFTANFRSAIGITPTQFVRRLRV